MRKDRDFEIRTIIRNGRKMRVRIPIKTISEEEFKRKLYEVFKKHV